MDTEGRVGQISKSFAEQNEIASIPGFLALIALVVLFFVAGYYFFRWYRARERKIYWENFKNDNSREPWL